MIILYLPLPPPPPSPVFILIPPHINDQIKGSTKGIVVGTRSGDLYESSLESNGKERPFSLVYTLLARRQQTGSSTSGSSTSGSNVGGIGNSDGRGGSGAVAALHLESMSAAVHGETRVFVMAVTATPLRLYLFVGGPTLEVWRPKASWVSLLFSLSHHLFRLLFGPLSPLVSVFLVHPPILFLSVVGNFISIFLFFQSFPPPLPIF